MGSVIFLLAMLVIVWLIVNDMQKISKKKKTGEQARREVKWEKEESGKLEYRARKSLLPNRDAVTMFERLCEAMPNHHIHAEVGLQALMQATGENSWSGKGAISQSRIDFVVTDSKGDVLCAIELDGKSHDNSRAAAKDAKKNEQFRLAGLKLIRIRTEAMPKGDALRLMLLG